MIPSASLALSSNPVLGPRVTDSALAKSYQLPYKSETSLFHHPQRDQLAKELCEKMWRGQAKTRTQISAHTQLLFSGSANYAVRSRIPNVNFEKVHLDMPRSFLELEHFKQTASGRFRIYQEADFSSLIRNMSLQVCMDPGYFHSSLGFPFLDPREEFIRDHLPLIRLLWGAYRMVNDYPKDEQQFYLLNISVVHDEKSLTNHYRSHSSVNAHQMIGEPKVGIEFCFVDKNGTPQSREYAMMTKSRFEMVKDRDLQRQNIPVIIINVGDYAPIYKMSAEGHLHSSQKPRWKHSTTLTYNSPSVITAPDPFLSAANTMSISQNMLLDGRYIGLLGKLYGEVYAEIEP